MTDDLEQRDAAGREILLGLEHLTPGQMRRLVIRHTDAFSADRREARARARSVARDLGLITAFDGLVRDAARATDLPTVPERSRDTFSQLATDAAVSAFLGDSLDEETRTLLARPWVRATRRRTRS